MNSRQEDPNLFVATNNVKATFAECIVVTEAAWIPHRIRFPEMFNTTIICIYGGSDEKIPSEMEVAPRYNCWHCWHCWHCWQCCHYWHCCHHQYHLKTLLWGPYGTMELWQYGLRPHGTMALWQAQTTRRTLTNCTCAKLNHPLSCSWRWSSVWFWLQFFGICWNRSLYK